MKKTTIADDTLISGSKLAKNLRENKLLPSGILERRLLILERSESVNPGWTTKACLYYTLVHKRTFSK